MNKKENNFQQKSWITKGLQVSVKIKSFIFRKYIKFQTKISKKDLHFQYQNYRTLLATLLKDSKQAYFTSYFKKRINDINKTYKGMYLLNL